jgi:hypothetical protein
VATQCRPLRKRFRGGDFTSTARHSPLPTILFPSFANVWPSSIVFPTYIQRRPVPGSGTRAFEVDDEGIRPQENGTLSGQPPCGSTEFPSRKTLNLNRNTDKYRLRSRAIRVTIRGLFHSLEI